MSSATGEVNRIDKDIVEIKQLPSQVTELKKDFDRRMGKLGSRYVFCENGYIGDEGDSKWYEKTHMATYRPRF